MTSQLSGGRRLKVLPEPSPPMTEEQVFVVRDDGALRAVEVRIRLEERRMDPSIGCAGSQKQYLRGRWRLSDMLRR